MCNTVLCVASNGPFHKQLDVVYHAEIDSCETRYCVVRIQKTFMCNMVMCCAKKLIHTQHTVVCYVYKKIHARHSVSHSEFQSQHFRKRCFFVSTLSQVRKSLGLRLTGGDRAVLISISESAPLVSRLVVDVYCAFPIVTVTSVPDPPLRIILPGGLQKGADIRSA